MYVWMKTLGWINFTLLVINTSLFLTRWFYRTFNKRLERFPWEGFKKLMVMLAAVHPWTGTILLFTALYHGYLATGGFVLYSGSLVFIGVVVFFASANSLFLQEFQRTFLPGNFVNEFSLANS